MKIIEPTVLLNAHICKANIRNMAEKARNNNLSFRPHFKTHQSVAISKWFREEGVNKITTSSLAMAEYFAHAGWMDITVAFPVNVLEIDRINQLAQKINLNLLVVHLESLDMILKDLEHRVGVFIKIDVGTHRTGLPPNDYENMDAIIQKSNGSKLLDFRGFLAHAGHTYAAKGRASIQKIHEDTIFILKQLKQKYVEKYPELVISTGDTPSCSVAEGWEEIDEIRPGNFVFYDLTQVEIGSCGLNDIAVALACPVVAKHAERSEIIIYGGGIHLSKDRLIKSDGKTIYGVPVLLNENAWKNWDGDSYVKSLSQEHGIVKTSPEFFKKVQIGDVIGILPVHSCMNVDLAGHYLTFENEKIDKFSFGR